MKYAKIIFWAIACHIMSFVIIGFQIGFTAATMGFGGFVLEIPLYIIPVITIFFIGVSRGSSNLMLVLPTYLLIWSGPAILHRLTLAPEYSAINSPSTVELFAEHRPEQLTLLIGENPNSDLRTLLHQEAIGQLTIAHHNWWSDKSPSIYNDKLQTLDFSELIFKTQRKEELANCDSWDLYDKVHLEDYGEPACVETRENVSSLPEHVVFTHREIDGNIKSTHTLFGRIKPTEEKGIYQFEELKRHTQRQKFYRSLSLIPGTGWSTLLRRDKTLWTMQTGPVVVLEAGTDKEAAKDLIVEGYQSAAIQPQYPVREPDNFYKLMDRLSRTGTSSAPDERLDEIFAGANRESVLSRLAEIDAELPEHQTYPNVSRMYALKGLRDIAGYLCANGAVNETVAFVVGSQSRRGSLQETCHDSLDGNKNIAAFMLGKVTREADKARQEERKVHAGAVTARLDELRRTKMEVTIDNAKLRLRLRPNRITSNYDSFVFEANLYEKGRRFDEVKSVGFQISFESPQLLSGTEYDYKPAGYIEVRKNRYGDNVSFTLSASDLADIMRILDGPELKLVLLSANDKYRLWLGPQDVEKLKELISFHEDVTALRSKELEYAVPGATY